MAFSRVRFSRLSEAAHKFPSCCGGFDSPPRKLQDNNTMLARVGCVAVWLATLLGMAFLAYLVIFTLQAHALGALRHYFSNAEVIVTSFADGASVFGLDADHEYVSNSMTFCPNLACVLR